MTIHLLDQPVTSFLDVLASKAPTPGGGSVAAVSAAMAAGLLTMVCDLTIGKKAYAGFEGEARQIRDRAEALRAELQQLAQADVTVFDALSAAYKLPRTSEEERASRHAAIQAATSAAADVPLRIAHQTAALLPLCEPLAQYGNRMAVSDVGVAALLIRAAVPSALLNVEINAATLDNADEAHQLRTAAAALTKGLDADVEAVLGLVRGKIG